MADHTVNEDSAITLVIYRDGQGFGMKVSGDKPVHVQSVKEDGAAARAGLQAGDKIIKVNGVNVTQCTHAEVVQLIKKSRQAILTVQKKENDTLNTFRNNDGAILNVHSQVKRAMTSGNTADKTKSKSFFEESPEKQPYDVLQDVLSSNFYKNFKASRASNKDPLQLTKMDFNSSFNPLGVSFDSSIKSDTDDLACNTPPGTPPPPYMSPIFSNTSQVSNEISQLDSGDINVPPRELSVNPNIQQSIMSMEDDDMSDQEVGKLEDHGPFRSLSKLWKHHAHLAVFINYLLSNSEPSSLLFYLITDLYREGNAKEMKKWAYEIHSTFLVPGAPLRLNNVDENMAREVDEVLIKESDKEEILRKIFWKARTKAKEELNEQLNDFQQKRIAGLGTLFGPSDILLCEGLCDKSREMKIVEKYLCPKMTNYIEELEEENEDEKKILLAASLATILTKVFQIRTLTLDRIPIFIAKDKSLTKGKTASNKSKKLSMRGHSFIAQHYFTVTYCNHCQSIIGGIGPQGYQCANCFFNVHRKCVRVNEESCPGPLSKKDKGHDRISKFMDRIRPDKKIPLISSQTHCAGEIQKVLSTESEKSNDTSLENASSLLRTASSSTENDQKTVLKKQGASSISRSESYKEQIHTKKKHRQKRKTSDPNISGSKRHDAAEGLSEQTDSSSSSSLSARSMSSSKLHLDHHCLAIDKNISNPWQSDDDLEVESNWTQRMNENLFVNMNDTEKKRQEVINELFQTEHSHVRALKILVHIFYKPMTENQILPLDQLNLLFANLDEMLCLHSKFNQSMKQLKKKNIFIEEVGSLLLDMFDGDGGQIFEKAASKYCSKQQIALRTLRDQRRRDAKLNNFLNEIEANPICKRLQLKDHILSGMLRLTKYPLLFENLSKYSSDSNMKEKMAVIRSLERSKEILFKVNHAVREAEDHYRLAEIQKIIDNSILDKFEHPFLVELKNLDITNRLLIYEGPLQWRVVKGKLVDLHVVLLDNSILFLHRTDNDKFDVKFNQINALMLSPILKLSTILVRDNAVEKDSLYLINTSQNGAQIYDLVASSPLEKKTWYDHILSAAEKFQTKDRLNKKPLMQCLSSSYFNDINKESPDMQSQDFLGPEILRNNKSKVFNSMEDVDSCNNLSTEESDLNNREIDHLKSNSAMSDQNISKLESIIGILNVIEPFKMAVSSDADESVQINEQKIYHATSVVTPLERLRRVDEIIKENVLKKHSIVNNILEILNADAELPSHRHREFLDDKNPTNIVFDSIAKINQLLESLNRTLNIYEEDVITASQNPTDLSNQTSHSCSCTSAEGNSKSREPAVPVSLVMPICHDLLSNFSQLLRVLIEDGNRQINLRNELKVVRERLHSIIDNEQMTNVEEFSPVFETQPFVENSDADERIDENMTTGLEHET